MDLRNDTMKIVYPFAGAVKAKEEFNAGLASHMGGRLNPIKSGPEIKSPRGSVFAYR